jgi:hypothetical protein
MGALNSPCTDDLDASHLAVQLDAQGWALLPSLLDEAECVGLRALYDRDDAFRSTIVMARHGFGSGEYRYFSYPLPPLVARLRAALYPPLAEVANCWAAALGEPAAYPDDHGDYLARCRAAGQSGATPLLLRYRAGDYNALHQDVYGEMVFPLQVAILLSEPGKDFDGGEFLLVEQRPRMQSRGSVVPLCRGDAVIFPVRHRPVRGSRSFYRAAMRHGVSQIHSGERLTLGLIFHDAR